MIYTATLNPSLDKTITAPNFRLNAVNRATATRTDAGGKGVNVSKCIAALGGASTALVLVGGGAGRYILDYLEARGIETLPFWAEGESRTNVKIADPASVTQTDVNEPGPPVTAELLAEIESGLRRLLCPGDILVLAGSLPVGAPPAFCRELGALCGEKGAAFYLDADGDALREGLRARPRLVKPNLEELARLAGRPLHSQDEILGAAKQLLASGTEKVVVSMGAEGAYFITRERTLRTRPVSVEVRGTVGAGDAMVAALAYGEARQMLWEEQARLAAALATASVMCEGSAAPPLKTVEKLRGQIIIDEVY